MKRRDRDLAGKLALALRLQKRLRALAHFARRLVGERDRDDPRGSVPCSIRCAILAVMTRVLPLPAPASTSNGPSQ
jgi:hypothetical protein